ncbi:polysaccharide lyase family 8 super-sandwich domain-containing protein [Planctomycetota bacterium]
MTIIFRTLLPIVLLLLLDGPVHAADDDFEIVKKRVVTELMKASLEDSRVETLMDRIQGDGSFKGINYDDLSRPAGFPHRHHTDNLVTLAQAYVNKASSYYQNKMLKDRIERVFSCWVDKDYVGDNWHDNQITTPTNLVKLMLIMGDDLPPGKVEKAQPIIGRAHMKASGARPSGDRIVIAGILAKNLLVMGDRQRFGEIIKLIEGEVKFRTGQRGIQHDYSFHHRVDRVNNTTSYGYGKYANAFGEWSYYVANTKYAFSVARINQLVDYYLDGIYKQMVYGVYTDISVKNRSITQKATFKPHGITEIERLLVSTDYRSDELREIMKLRRGEAKPSRSFCKFFWQTEHFVVQRPNYYTTVRMFSTRNRNMEMPYNGPGKPTHHRADGTNYLMLKGDEYHNIWPVYDWQKISGTTILQKPALPGPNQIQKAGLTDFVGAVTDGQVGAVAFDFKSPHDLTVAKKAWFFFEDEYVCLGTAIASDRDLPVATTVNQVLMRSDVTVRQGDAIRQLPRGSRQMDDVRWIHQDRIGYLFPYPTMVYLSNQTQQGRWSDITDQKHISTKLISEDVFTLWFDHGPRPSHASYQYIVVPDVNVPELQKTAATNRGINILSNTAEIQAVRHQRLGMCQIAFYQAGDLAIAEDLRIHSESQGMVMLQMQGDAIVQMTFADPSRKLSQMRIHISGIYSVQAGHAVSQVDNELGTTHLLVDLPQGVYAGQSAVVQICRRAPCFLEKCISKE